MQVSGDLGPQLVKLKSTVEIGQSRYELQQFLQKSVAEQCLAEERESLQFHSKMGRVLFDGLQQFAPQVL